MPQTILYLVDRSVIVSRAVFRNTGQRYTFILILPNFPEGEKGTNERELSEPHSMVNSKHYLLFN